MLENESSPQLGLTDLGSVIANTMARKHKQSKRALIHRTSTLGMYSPKYSRPKSSNYTAEQHRTVRGAALQVKLHTSTTPHARPNTLQSLSAPSKMERDQGNTSWIWSSHHQQFKSSARMHQREESASSPSPTQILLERFHYRQIPDE